MPDRNRAEGERRNTPGKEAVRGDVLQAWKAEFFKALAHPARIRILEALRAGERSAGEIMEELGLEQSNGSQHLAVLRNKDFVTARRAGTTILYAVRDPLIYQVLDLLRDYFYEHLSEVRTLLEAMAPPPAPEGPEEASEAAAALRGGADGEA